MRKLFILTIGIFALQQGIASAQIGLNSISVSTTSEGNVAWSANVDGHNRRGYLDKHISSEDICSKNQSEMEIIAPIYSHIPNDILLFTGTGYDNFKVTIKNEAGKVIAIEQYSEELSMDISLFEKGVYTIEIVAERTQQVKTKIFTKE